MLCILYKQFPLNKIGLKGSLAVHNKEAMFIVNDKVVETLEKPEILFINPHGIMLKGYEPNGIAKIGVAKYNYQEWYCSIEKV